MPYSPSFPSELTSVDSLRQWLFEELKAISRELSEFDALDLRPVFRAPLRPREGMIIYPDGATYNPSTFGEGPHYYNGSAFVRLAGESETVRFGSVRLQVFTVATLPASPVAGQVAYASNLRVFDAAGVQQGAGAGTGGVVVYNGTNWKNADAQAVTAVA